MTTEEIVEELLDVEATESVEGEPEECAAEIVEDETSLNATTETVKALVNLIVPLGLMFATLIGVKSDMTWAAEAVCIFATFATFVYSWWENNNITEAARAAQKVLNELKAGE